MEPTQDDKALLATYLGDLGVRSATEAIRLLRERRDRALHLWRDLALAFLRGDENDQRITGEQLDLQECGEHGWFSCIEDPAAKGGCPECHEEAAYEHRLEEIDWDLERAAMRRLDHQDDLRALQEENEEEVQF